eukprot:366209-Chlamydomonas_euryale.AAC.3
MLHGFVPPQELMRRGAAKKERTALVWVQGHAASVAMRLRSTSSSRRALRHRAAAAVHAAASALCHSGAYTWHGGDMLGIVQAGVFMRANFVRPEEVGEWWLPRRKGFNVHTWRAKCRCGHAHDVHEPLYK